MNTFVVVYVAFVSSLEEGKLQGDAGRSAGIILALLTIVVLLFGVAIVSYAAWTAGQAHFQQRWSQSSFHFGGSSFKSFRSFKSSHRTSKSSLGRHSQSSDKKKVLIELDSELIQPASYLEEGEKSGSVVDIDPCDNLRNSWAQEVGYPEEMHGTSGFSDKLAFDDGKRRSLEKIKMNRHSARYESNTSIGNVVSFAAKAADIAQDRPANRRAKYSLSSLFPAAVLRASTLGETSSVLSRLSDAMSGNRSRASSSNDAVNDVGGHRLTDHDISKAAPQVSRAGLETSRVPSRLSNSGRFSRAEALYAAAGEAK